LHKRYILGEAPCEQILTKKLHIGRYAGRNHLCKFWCGKIGGLGIHGGQSLGSPIETAGQPNNSGALPHSLWLITKCPKSVLQNLKCSQNILAR